jgi:uncharacterized protein (DUF983 family)
MTPERTTDLKIDMLKGFLGRCPACGKGKMFRSFLKVAHECECCGQELFHHQADDFPAYLVIMVVGHLIAGVILWVETAQLMSSWAELVLFVPLTFILSVALLQPTKGAVVALQWHLGMHGFRTAKHG